MRSNSNRYTCDAQPLYSPEISIDRGITEASLTFLCRLIETALSVGRHEQDDTYTCITPGLYYCFRHHIGISVGLTTWLMMHIMKFSDAGITSSQHLTIGA